LVGEEVREPAPKAEGLRNVVQKARDAGTEFAGEVFEVRGPIRVGEKLFWIPWGVSLVGEEHTDVYVSPEAFDGFIDCFCWGGSPWLEAKVQTKAKKGSKFLGWLVDGAEVVASEVSGLG
jgi:hypothetical protein